MSTHSRIAFVPTQPARPENKEPHTWTWTSTPSTAADDECPHGFADRAWCGFCSPAASHPRRRNGR
jgi:hypothetical protein